MLILWLKRSFFSAKRFFKFKVFISLLGLILGVASLSITMIVMSSYEATLKQTFIQSTGHLSISKKIGEHPRSLLEKVLPLMPQEVRYTPFISKEVLALSEDGKTAGALLEGLDPHSMNSVVNLSAQLVEGRMFMKKDEIVIGKELATNLNLKLGSVLSIVFPNQDSSAPIIQRWKVAGILDLGHYDLNSRYIVTTLKIIQPILNLGDRVQGFRFFFPQKVSSKLLHTITQSLPPDYRWSDWKSIYKNLLSAIQMEKAIIFIILLILIVAAAFNVANQFFIDILRRFKDIGILKSIGGSPSLIFRLFVTESLAISITGTLLGLTLGASLIKSLVYFDLWKMWIPADVYKLNQIVIDIRFLDFLVIFIATVIICLLSSLIPIRRVLLLSPKEGLEHE